MSADRRAPHSGAHSRICRIGVFFSPELRCRQSRVDHRAGTDDPDRRICQRLGRSDEPRQRSPLVGDQPIDVRRLRHHDIDPAHLLLAVLRQDGSVAASILEQNGARLETMREEFVQLLK